jgi:MFS transporter, SP family, xylose:H+ symportor
MHNRLLRCVLIVSMAGFLFGFDSVLISGVNLPVKRLWNLSDWFHGAFIISISLWGTVVGALVGGYPADRWGRKRTLILVGILFTISALGTAFATSPYVFSFFRFLGGVAAGAGSIAAPAYISEVSLAKHRGKLGMLFQLNLVTGILMAFLSNYALDGVGGNGNDWRWMMGIMLIPSLIFTVLLLNIVESPRWSILKKKNTHEALQTLKLIISTEEIDELMASSTKKASMGRDHARLFSGKYNRILAISLLITFFNQFSGISFILFYAPEIFGKAGFATAESLLGGVSIGLANLAFTLAGMYLIDRIGRRKLMYVGSVGYIVSLAMIACGFYFGLPANYTLIFMLTFIASHSIGQGAIIWVYIAEIFPTSVRSFGQAWGSGLLNIFAAVITLVGAVLINAFSPWVLFASFAALMVLQLLFTAFVMPETRGVPLEELEAKLVTSSAQ